MQVFLSTGLKLLRPAVPGTPVSRQATPARQARLSMSRVLSLALAAALAASCFSATAGADEGKQPHPISFRNDVEPILTRLGCNQGACHGKAAGQNGFRLSLRGYAPELDHEWMTREYAGRRIDPTTPEASLLLL